MVRRWRQRVRLQRRRLRRLRDGCVVVDFVLARLPLVSFWVHLVCFWLIALLELHRLFISRVVAAGT
jgi:hypothetical protein